MGDTVGLEGKTPSERRENEPARTDPAFPSRAGGRGGRRERSRAS